MSKDLTPDELLDHSPNKFSRKYPMMTPSDMAEKDPRYLVWAYENIKGSSRVCSRALYESCLEDIQEGDAEGHDPDEDDPMDQYGF